MPTDSPPASVSAPPPSRRAALREPLLVLAAVHAAGAALAVHSRPAALFTVPLLLLLFLPRAWIQGRPRLLAAMGWFGLAAAISLWRTHAPAGSLPGHFMERPREWMEIEAVVLAEPSRDARVDGTASPWKAPVRIEAMRRLPEWQAVDARCMVHWPADAPDPGLRPTDRVRLSGVLREEAGPSAGLHLSRYRLDAGPEKAGPMAASGAGWISSVAQSFRAYALETLARGLDDRPEERGVILGLLLGARSGMDPELNQLFAVTSTLHLFSISGLHVGMVAAILVLLFRAAGLRRDRWILLLFPALLLFVVATGAKPSAIRALIMASLYWGAPLVRRKPNAASALAASLILVLILSPLQVFEVGCQFSFLVVAGMIGLTPLLAAPFRRWFAPDPWAPPVPAGFRAALRRRAGNYGAGFLAPTFAAWIAGTPLTAWYFNLFSPVGLVANLVVVPAGFVIVMLGAASLFAGVAFPALAALINGLNATAVSLLMRGIEAFSRIPAAWEYVMTPSLLAVVASYLLMAWVALAGRPTRVWTATLAGCLIAFGLSVRERMQFRGVLALDAGDGQAALILAPGFAALADSGPMEESGRVIRALRREGIDRLDVLLLTHSAAAHLGGTPRILRELRPREVWIPSSAPARSPALDAALAAVREAGVPVRRLAAGDSGDWEGGLHWRVLHPPADAGRIRRAADTSLVLHISSGHRAVLLGGGAGRDAEIAVATSGQNAACDVFVPGNDRDEGACTAELLASALPARVVLAGGAHSAVFRRGLDVRGRILSRGIELMDATLFGPVRIDLSTGRAQYTSP